MTYLDKMVPGQRGTVLGIVNDSPLARRLMELGLMPGRIIEYVRNAPLSDPMQIRVGDNSLSLRHAEASVVTVELEE